VVQEGSSIIRRVRQLSKKRLVILALILFAFILGYGGGRFQLIGNTGEQWIFHTGEWLYSRLARVERTMSDIVIDVDLRGYYDAGSDPVSSHFFPEHKSIPVNEAALILVDVWEIPTSGKWLHERQQEITSTNIYNVLQAARENNMLIIHAPAADDAISHIVSPLANEIVLDSSNWIPDNIELHLILLKYDIKTLFYVGFATNDCILDRPYGIKQMHHFDYQIILLRDGTLGNEFHDTLEGMWVTRIALREVEKMPGGYTVTAEDFIEGFAKQVVNPNK